MIKTVRKTALTDVVQWEGNNRDELLDFTSGFEPGARFRVLNERLEAEVYDYLHESWIPLELYDYVARGPDAECYPIKSSVFVKTYKELNWFDKLIGKMKNA